jgi:phospho-N-acetylmuramoyl-pentapeptide-transferase
MLLELFEWLARDIRAFNVFSYLTLRAVLAAGTALVIGLLAGPWVIRKLTELKIGQAIRTEGPQSHLVKSGTPTMGGALILISIGVTTLLWADLTNRFVWVVLLVTLGFGWVGWVDDYRKVVRRNPKGMSAREKYFWQSLIGLVAAFYLAFAIAAPNTEKLLPLMWQWVNDGFELDLPSRSEDVNWEEDEDEELELDELGEDDWEELEEEADEEEEEEDLDSWSSDPGARGRR